MIGAIALHGGGEYLPGDEPFLDALLDAAERRPGALPGDPIRVVILPTAAARGRPEVAAQNGVAAFERRGLATSRSLRVEVAMVVDAATADDAALSARLAAADVVHLPGGDPDLTPTILAGRSAGRAILAALDRGAVVAGASAGGMALCEWTWTPHGGIHGLGLVRGLAVVPHYDDIRRTSWQATLDGLAPGGIGYLGLDERTGVLGNGTGDWFVAGAGAASWFARGATEPLVARHGDRLPLPALGEPV
jgi:cyanophycinase